MGVRGGLRLRALAAGLLVVAALSGCGPEEEPEEQPAALRYVALGDSFSAGKGVEPYEPASGQHPDCDQSGNAYPRLLHESAVVDVELVGFLACSDATTQNITTTPQFDPFEAGGSTYLPQFTQLMSLAMLGEVDLVTLTIGGNDITFKEFAEACAPPGDTLTACQQARDASLRLVATLLPDRLKKTYEKIRATVGPDTLVLVLGYPQMVPHGAYDPLTGPTICSWLSQTGLDPVEVGYAQEITVALNGAIRAAVSQAGPNFEYLDPEQDGPFDVARHGICTDDSYFNGITLDLDGIVPNFYDSFHPNKRGQQAYADMVIAHLQNRKAPSTPGDGVVDRTPTPTVEVPTGPTTEPTAPDTKITAPPQLGDLLVVGNDADGTQYHVTRTGQYRFAYKDGAISAWPDDNWGPDDRWETTVVAFRSDTPIRDGAALDRDRQLFALADHPHSLTQAEAIDKAKQQATFYDIHLSAGEVITLVAVDDSWAYEDNPGTITVHVSYTQ